jgi:putative ABC transport system permease protein
MILVAVKGLLAHKLRVLMTALSIALGVAFVSGTFTLTDALNNSFSSAVTSQYAGVDVVVRAPAAFVDSEAIGQRQPLPAGVLDAVRAVPGVDRADGSVSGHATIVGTDGKALGRGALSTDGMSVPAAADSDVSYRDGRAPAGAAEVAVDAASAENGGIAVGDRVRILFRGPPREFTVVGVAEFGGQSSLGSTTTALFDLPTAQSVLDRPGQYDEIRVVAADGVSAGALRAEIGRALPQGLEAATAAAGVAERTELR